MEDYQYTPLNLEKPAIRLLCLHPGKGSIISCELFQAELHQRENTVSYEALSYTWGSSRLSVTIHVNGCCLSITRSLYNALLDLRYPQKQRILWIDAVCIDQGNDKERGHQVGHMGNIYKEADSVIFRLGWGSFLTDLFMESLQRLQKESIQHACRAWSREDSRWEGLWIRSFQPVLEEHDADLTKLQQGLQEILEQPWFRRVWILQEVAFAKAGIISCGKKTVSARLFGLTPLLLGITPDAHCQSVLDIMPSPWRETTWWSESRSFYKLLLNFGGSEATDPRDLVYALRGMSSDLADKYDSSLFPNYEKPQDKLVHDVFQYIYAFDVNKIKEVSGFYSMRKVVSNLPRLETDICRFLAGQTKVLASQDIIEVAAQDGKLPRYRGKEFTIDDEVLVCAAANLNAAEAVFEVFSCHQGQSRPIITEQYLIAAAKNPKSGPSAMRFLLSLKTQVYGGSPLSKAVAAITPHDLNLRGKIHRILRQQENNNNNTIASILTVAADICSSSFQQEIIRILLQHIEKSNEIISEVLAAAADIQLDYSKAELMRNLLEQENNSNESISKILTIAAGIRSHGSDILEGFLRVNPDFGISGDAAIAAMGHWPGDDKIGYIAVLCRYFPDLWIRLRKAAGLLRF